MLKEFFQTLFSDAPDWAKQQNLVKESVAIKARYERQKSHWASHLLNSQNEILKFRIENQEAKKIAVFGSGHLFDFPQELLCNPSLHIFLFDAVHPREIRAESFKARVQFINCDLNLKPQALFERYGKILEQCELFVSTNLLSQLALSGSARLQKNETERTKLAQSIIENHLLFLHSLPGRSLLISDFEKKFIGTADEKVLEQTTLWGYTMAKPLRSWLWDLAPFGEISKKYRVELEVGTWRIN